MMQKESTRTTATTNKPDPQSNGIMELDRFLAHVLNVVHSSTRELGIEKESWRFRIAEDPRLFMDNLKERAFHSFVAEDPNKLRDMLKDLRDIHHFVIPHNAKIDTMQGHFLVMFSAMGVRNGRSERS